MALGGEASWVPIANECISYNQIETTLNCYLRPDRFDALPEFPSCLLKEGCESFMVSYKHGEILGIPGIDKIRNLSSFRRVEMQTQVGSKLFPTIDCFTRPGSVQLVHEAPAQLLADYKRIRELEKDDSGNGLFVLSTIPARLFE